MGFPKPHIMNKTLLLPLLLLLTLCISSCSKDDCTKMMDIPYLQVVNYQFKTYFVSQEVPCDFPAPEPMKMPPELKNFSYHVLDFTYIPDTGNQTSRLRFEIQLNNQNDYAVEGLAFLTIQPEGDSFSFTGNYSRLALVPCNKIAANSSCTLTFDQEYPLDPNVGTPSGMTLLDVKYYAIIE